MTSPIYQSVSNFKYDDQLRDHFISKNLLIKEINKNTIEIKRLREELALYKSAKETLNLMLKEKEATIEELKESWDKWNLMKIGIEIIWSMQIIVFRMEGFASFHQTHLGMLVLQRLALGFLFILPFKVVMIVFSLLSGRWSQWDRQCCSNSFFEFYLKGDVTQNLKIF